MSGSYDDIIALPHHVSMTHPRMPVGDRAAQFSPFAALTGYDAAVAETARLTDGRIELDENRKAEIDQVLRAVGRRLGERPSVALTYYVPDLKKAGGAYITAVETVKKLDEYALELVTEDGKRIAFEDIADIELRREREAETAPDANA